MKNIYIPAFMCCFAAALFIFITACQSEKSAEKNPSFPVTTFRIQANADTTLFGPQGTRVFVEAGTFRHQDGKPVTGPVELRMQEFYQKSAMVLANLSTTAGGRMLETGGMLYLEASSDGQPLTIDPDKRVILHFPKSRKDTAKMSLFVARGNTQQEGVSDWEQDTASLMQDTLIELGWMCHDSAMLAKHEALSNSDFVFRNYMYLRAKFQSKFSILSIKNTYRIDYSIKNNKIVNTYFFSRFPDNRKPWLLERSRASIPPVLKALEDSLFVWSYHAVSVPSPSYTIKAFEKKQQCQGFTVIENIDETELNYYILSVSNLGWINCDRFYDVPEKADVIVQTPVSSTVSLKMVFADINSVMQASVVDGHYVFPQVPLNQKVTLIGMDHAPGGFKAAFYPCTTSQAPISALPFAPMTFEALKQKITVLDS